MGLTPYGDVMSARGKSCFYCHAPTGDPAVCWMGHDATLFLHVGCAVELCLRLLRDVHEWECRDGGRVVLGVEADKPTAMRAARHGGPSEEHGA